jgi:carbon-monoxide dehydrogenase medium subunit
MFPREITKTLKLFGYFSPCEISEAVLLLEKLGDKARVLAGGTDLIHTMRLRQIMPEYLISIKGIVDLNYLKDNTGLEMGTLTRISTIKESEIIKEKYISLYEATEWFGSPQIRNMATVGGNICRSSPSSDFIPPLMALGAVLRLVGPRGGRDVLLEEFLLGSGKNILDQEILTSIFVPIKGKNSGAAFKKLMRSSQDLAKVSVAVSIVVEGGRCRDIRIVLGAVADKVFRAKKAESILRGEQITERTIKEVAQKAAMEAQPITDVRSTAEYRSHVIKVLVDRLVRLSVERAEGKCG